MLKITLQKSVVDSICVFNNSKKDWYEKTFVKYLGSVETKGGRTFKLLTCSLVWGPNRHTTGTIYVFNEKNQSVGKYHLGDGTDIPDSMKNGVLIFINNNRYNCDPKLITRISLRNGLPQNIFIKCRGKYGDIYSFSDND